MVTPLVAPVHQNEISRKPCKQRKSFSAVVFLTDGRHTMLQKKTHQRTHICATYRVEAKASDDKEREGKNNTQVWSETKVSQYGCAEGN